MALLKRLALVIALAGATYAQADRFGTPACSATHQEFADRSFSQLCYDASRKVSIWVGYELKPEHLIGSVARRLHFRADHELASQSAEDADYRNSGYSRGHLAPARDLAWSEQAMRASFLLTNAAPQLQSVNAGLWARVETLVRQIAAKSDAVYVFTGVLFANTPSTIGPGQVAVPGYFYKVALAISGSTKRMYAAIVPNAIITGQPLSAFLTTVNAIEDLTGLDFFPELDDDEEERLESAAEASPPETPTGSGDGFLSPQSRNSCSLDGTANQSDGRGSASWRAETIGSRGKDR